MTKDILGTLPRKRKKYLKTDVLEEAITRIDMMLQSHDLCYVSFSGGKDSSVLLNLVVDRYNALGKPCQLGVMHLDYEAQYQATTDFVSEVLSQLPNDIERFHVCAPFKVQTCTSMFQNYWRPWDPNCQEIWVRDRPKETLSKTDFGFWNDDLWDYDFQERFGVWVKKEKNINSVCCFVGIRTDESLNRFRTIASSRRIHTWNNLPWTKQIGSGVTNAYPLYDWALTDIWTANYRFNWDYNTLYDLMHLAGVPPGEQRVASPFLSTAQESLHLYQVIDPNIWGRLVGRVNGVNFTALYGRTTMMGWKNVQKPGHFTWREYAYFLLSTLPDDTAELYRSKIETSLQFWLKKGGSLETETISFLKNLGVSFEINAGQSYRTSKSSVRMETLDDYNGPEFNLVPSWKRICVTILKNDVHCKTMGFAPPKSERAKRDNALKRLMAL